MKELVIIFIIILLILGSISFIIDFINESKNKFVIKQQRNVFLPF